MTDTLPPEVRPGDEVVHEGDRYAVQKVTKGETVRAERTADGRALVFEVADAAEGGSVTLLPREVLKMGEDTVAAFQS